jgi:nitrite reductase/ring-hydroxylating ferredoxin subunit
VAARERVIGAGADLVDGGPGIRFTIERDGRAVEAFAIRHRGVVRAYVNACAHREVELDWLPGAFFTADRLHLVCSLHGALYEPDTGRCIAGPCRGAALVALPVREREGDRAIVIAAPDPVPAVRPPSG